MPRLREPPKQEPTPKEPDEQKIIGTPEPEGDVVVAGADEAIEDFKKQIETLKRSEEAARQQAIQANRDREAALARVRERDGEVARTQKESSQYRLDAITNAMAAAEAEAEGAKRAFRMAAAEQDIEGQIAAQERLAEAKANLVNLTNGKAAMEEEARRMEAQPKPTVQEDPLDRSGLPDTAKNWLRAHPEYLSDARKNAKIQALHWDVIDEGHQPFSEAYYVSLEQHLGLRSKPRQSVADEDDEPEAGRTIVSAPVSREVPSSSRTPRNVSEVKLTAAQREIAKSAGITEAEYAKQLLRLNQEKGNGNYGGAP